MVHEYVRRRCCAVMKLTNGLLVFSNVSIQSQLDHLHWMRSMKKEQGQTCHCICSVHSSDSRRKCRKYVCVEARAEQYGLYFVEKKSVSRRRKNQNASYFTQPHLSEFGFRMDETLVVRWPLKRCYIFDSLSSNVFIVVLWDNFKWTDELVDRFDNRLFCPVSQTFLQIDKNKQQSVLFISKKKPILFL